MRGPLVIRGMISYWILRKETVLGENPSLKMLDRVFKKIFPETTTPYPSQAQRDQHPRAVESKHIASREINMTRIPTIEEDVLYEHAFNELQGDKRVVATWSRASAEAEGEENKAKALYILARVASQKQALLAKFESDQLEAERLAREVPDLKVNEKGD